MRREVWESVGPFNAAYQFADTEWFLRVVEKFPVASLARSRRAKSQASRQLEQSARQRASPARNFRNGGRRDRAQLPLSSADHSGGLPGGRTCAPAWRSLCARASAAGMAKRPALPGTDFFRTPGLCARMDRARGRLRDSRNVRRARPSVSRSAPERESSLEYVWNRRSHRRSSRRRTGARHDRSPTSSRTGRRRSLSRMTISRSAIAVWRFSI